MGGPSAGVAAVVFRANLTALAKPDGGVRGIATGTSLRRLVAKVLARQIGPEFERACAPYQDALSTRAGTDCVAHAVQVATDAYPELTLVSVDGVGAYDNITRESMLSEFALLPAASAILPFVLLSYGRTSKYTDRHFKFRR